VATLAVRHSPASAAIARRNVADALQRAGVGSDQAFDAALIASELVGNAVRHGRPLPSGEILLEWQVSGESYYIAVTDGGNPPSVAAQTAAGQDVSGRGLMIVAALSQEWGVLHNGTSTTVWAQVRLSEAASPTHTLQPSGCN
jgi:anti-sigma regulatory factor (Ser/Thr protein kinase)